LAIGPHVGDDPPRRWAPVLFGLVVVIGGGEAAAAPEPAADRVVAAIPADGERCGDHAAIGAERLIAADIADRRVDLQAAERQEAELRQAAGVVDALLAERRAAAVRLTTVYNRLGGNPLLLALSSGRSPDRVARARGLIRQALIAALDEIGALQRRELEIAEGRARLAARLWSAQASLVWLAVEEARLAAGDGMPRPAACRAPPGLLAASAAAPAADGGLHRLRLPAEGRLVGGFGDDLGDGVRREGIAIEGAAGMPVVAPADGEIVYAGGFGRYGQILILDLGGGYHVLLTGLDRIDGGIGRKVVAGAPIGDLGPRSPQGAAVLSLELWHNHRPINPLPLLGAGVRRERE
jgi:septal ring factor EnvC (AmiA/AmiB activator)